MQAWLGIGKGVSVHPMLNSPRKSYGLVMTLRFPRQELRLVWDWWGLGPVVSGHPMLSHWSKLQQVCRLRGLVSSERVRFILGVSRLEGGHCGVCILEIVLRYLGG